jgi:MFS superfamily sulfate permease-like transporter
VSNLLSRPVLTGCAGGAAVIIAMGQIGKLLGVAIDGLRTSHVVAVVALSDALGRGEGASYEGFEVVERKGVVVGVE